MATLPPTSSSTRTSTPQLNDDELLTLLGFANGYNTIIPLFTLDPLLSQPAVNPFSIDNPFHQCGDTQHTGMNTLTVPPHQLHDSTRTQLPFQAQTSADRATVKPPIFSREGDLVGATSLPQSTGTQPEVFRCKWEGCQHSGIFRREAELMRHIKAIHISPRSFPCPARGCHKQFNRKDNLKEHLSRKHGV